ncbi:hypothetical protein Tco_1526467 [Tanacetum coccineum]
MPPEDEIPPAEEQPLPAADSPTADSPGYIPDSDPEEDDDEDPEDYPADGRDGVDDEDEPSDDDEDEEVDIKADDEEVEHPTPADSTAVALPAIDQAPSAEETEPFKTDESAATPPPHPAYRVTARISIPAPVPTPVWSDAEVARLLAISTLPSSPLPQIPYHHYHPIRPLGYRAAMIRLRAEAASTSHSLPLPPPIILSHTRPDALSSGTPPMHLFSIDRRADRPEVTLPPWKRLDIALGPRYEVRESSSAAAARPARVETMQGAPASADTKFVRLMTELETRVRQDTYEIYTRLDDEQTKRQLLAGRSTCYLGIADHKRQVHLTKALKLVKRLQTHMVELQRQQGPAKGLAQPELPKEAGSSS